MSTKGSEPVRAMDLIARIDEESAPAYQGEVFKPKDEVVLDLTGERLKILAEIAPEPDEKNLGPKYLTRTRDHRKKTVFAVEVSRAEKNLCQACQKLKAEQNREVTTA